MINKIIWAIAITLMFFNAIYFSIKLKFPQLNIKKMILSLLHRDKTNHISAIDTLMMSLANKIGVGSLAGISLAIYIGGVGTIFWMWIITIIISINTYLESALAVIYRKQDGIASISGPSCYIEKGLNNKKLSIIYAILIIISYIFCFLTIQTNTITVLVSDIFSTNKIIISIIITLISGIVIFKGINAIFKICSKIVPLMSLIYLLIGAYVIIINYYQIPGIFKDILVNAFNPKSISGGILYVFYIGLQKSIFATESGLGTGAIAVGASDDNNYLKQGYIQMIGIYFIGLVITTITAIIVLTSNYKVLNLTNPNGIEITKYAFNYHLGEFGNYILLIILVLFAFSTIITGYYYGESSLKTLTNKKTIILKIITVIVLFVGGIIKSNFIWELVNISVALLAIINMYSIYKLKNKIINKL